MIHAFQMVDDLIACVEYVENNDATLPYEKTLIAELLCQIATAWKEHVFPDPMSIAVRSKVEFIDP
jgi:hypothetical protein